MAHPPRPCTPEILAEVRRICLALPDTTEKEAWGAPTFRVKDKIFVMYAENHHNDQRIALWCACEREAQKMLVGVNPDRYFVPPYVGVKGWVGLRVDGDVDWKEVEDVVKTSYRMIAPKPGIGGRAPANKAAAPAKKKAAVPAKKAAAPAKKAKTRRS